MGYEMILDYGHGGSDSGAASNGLVEKDMNLVTGTECRRILEIHGVTVRTTRDSDKTVSLEERVRMANATNAKLFVSIHYNAGGGDGVESIHSVYAGLGESAAKTIVNAINKYTGQNLRPRATYSKRGTDNKDYYAVIRGTKMDAIIVESGFIDSEDRYLFDTIEEQRAMGRAIAYGILVFLGIPIIDDKPVKLPIPGGKYAIVTADALNVRNGRGTNFPVIGVLQNGTKVKLCYLLNGWWSIDYGSNVGYVSARYLQEV